MEFDVYTLGFSNRSWEETLKILLTFGIQRLIDIRTLPGSRRTPQFNLEHLEKALPEVGVEYFHIRSLGGLRKPMKSFSMNLGWRNEGFRGYADYMQTPEFESALTELIRLFTERTTCYCCTEAVFWRCHRQLVADALLVRGYKAGHIFTASKVELHQLTHFARVEEGRISYPSLL